MEIPGTKTQTSNNYYWSIISGRFARRVKEGGVKRTTKTGKVVNEEYVNRIEGVLLSININHSEYGEDISIVLTPAPGYTHFISIPKESRYAKSLIERLPMIQKGNNIQLKPYSFENQSGDKISGMNVFINEEKIESFFKEKKAGKYVYCNGYPPFPDDWKSLSEKEKKIYFLEVDEFLNKELNKWIER